jgi:hypothetical protein
MLGLRVKVSRHGARVRQGCAAMRRAMDARAAGSRCNAPRHGRMCSRVVVQCATAWAHVQQGRAAMRHGMGARAAGSCCNAPRHGRTCSRVVLQCATAWTHVQQGRGAMRHGMGARAAGSWCNAPRHGRMCSRVVVQCVTAWTHARQGRAAKRHVTDARAEGRAAVTAGAPPVFPICTADSCSGCKRLPRGKWGFCDRHASKPFLIKWLIILHSVAPEVQRNIDRIEIVVKRNPMMLH